MIIYVYMFLLFKDILPMYFILKHKVLVLKGYKLFSIIKKCRVVVIYNNQTYTHIGMFQVKKKYI